MAIEDLNRPACWPTLLKFGRVCARLRTVYFAERPTMNLTCRTRLWIYMGLAFASIACAPDNNSSTSGSGGLRGSSNAATGGRSATGGNGTFGTGGASAPTCPANQIFACPAIDSSRLLNSLDASETGLFCDCMAASAGGYGSPMCECPDGSSGGPGAPANQADCITGTVVPPSCPLTMSQFSDCANAMWSKPCDLNAIEASLQNANCITLLSTACQ